MEERRDLEAMSLTELVRLQTRISRTLARRFERPLALCFTDLVGSTAYFARHGDEAGRALQQLHYDLLLGAIPPWGGRIVDTAGDGAFLCFPTVDAALSALDACLLALKAENADRGREHRLVLRVGVHHGVVLTDGEVVSGDAVNVCARIASVAAPGEVWLSSEALREASAPTRLRCRPGPRVSLKGVEGELSLFVLKQVDELTLPTRLLVRETREYFELPSLDTIAIGRLREAENGLPANDVVLKLADKTLEQSISRWHFELRRRPEGYVLRAVSSQATEVDGRPVGAGEEVPVRTGSLLRLSRAVTLELCAGPDPATTLAPPVR